MRVAVGSRTDDVSSSSANETMTDACTCRGSCTPFNMAFNQYSVFTPTRCSTGSYMAVSPNVATTGSDQFTVYTVTDANLQLFTNGKAFSYFVAGSTPGSVTCFDAGSTFSSDTTSTGLNVIVDCTNIVNRCYLQASISYVCTTKATPAPTSNPTTGTPAGDASPPPTTSAVVIAVVVVVALVILAATGIFIAIRVRKNKKDDNKEDQRLLPSAPNAPNATNSNSNTVSVGGGYNSSMPPPPPPPSNFGGYGQPPPSVMGQPAAGFGYNWSSGPPGQSQGMPGPGNYYYPGNNGAMPGYYNNMQPGGQQPGFYGPPSGPTSQAGNEPPRALQPPAAATSSPATA